MGDRIIHVVGAGVSGLTCAILLAEAGHRVRILARERARDTVSRVAAALWLPYRAEPPERVFGWAERSFRVFEGLSRDPVTGVNLVPGVEVGVRPGEADWHRVSGAGVREARPGELPPGCEHGVSFVLPVCEMSIYIGYLEERLARAGGELEMVALADLDVAVSGADAVVNACGLGGRELLGDRELFPIRGQVVAVAREGIDRIFLDERDDDAIRYVIPRSTDVVFGGSVEVGLESLEPDERQTRELLAGCCELAGTVAPAVREVRVGLRPGRNVVRLEAERLADGTPVVHDYGHGGAGVTLSWGCAQEVLGLVEAAL